MRSAAERYRARLLWLLAIASALVHVTALWELPRPAPHPARVKAPATIRVTWVTSEPGRVPAAGLHTEPAAAQAAPTPEASAVEAARAAMRTERGTPHEREPSALEPVAQPPQPTPGGPALSVSERGPAAAAPTEPLPPAPATSASPDLSPHALALSSLAAATSGSGTPSARAASAAPPVARDEDLAARRSAELSAELGALANADRLRPKRAPRLERDSDGTCHYSGDAIDATILPDGGVRFEDKPARVEISSLQPLQPGQLLPRGGPEAPPERPVTPEDTVAPKRIEARLRVSPRAFTAEREWFLRETAGLRRELSDAARERELADGDRALRKQLDRIWCDAALPVAQRRARLFALWDETSGDEVGARGRRVILQYIRRNLPNDSAQAFPDTQLAALNASRMQRDRFDPYSAPGPADAGVGGR